MPTFDRLVQVPYSAAQMYQLVNDIQAYPEFLPGCAGAQIRSQTPTHVVASLEMAWGALRQAITTENTCVENHSIQMQFKEGPFRHLEGEWVFRPLTETTSEVSLTLDFEWQNAWMGMAFGRMAAPITERLIDVFLQRAQMLYGDKK